MSTGFEKWILKVCEPRDSAGPSSFLARERNVYNWRGTLHANGSANDGGEMFTIICTFSSRPHHNQMRLILLTTHCRCIIHKMQLDNQPATCLWRQTCMKIAVKSDLVTNPLWLVEKHIIPQKRENFFAKGTSLGLRSLELAHNRN